MSVFMVEDKTINNIVAYLAIDRDFEGFCKYRLKGTYINLGTPEARKSFANNLFKLNCAGVNERYGEDQAQEFRPLSFQYRSVLPPTIIQTYKALGCLIYQCSEGNVTETDLYRTLNEISNWMAHKIVSNLKAYNAAQWG